MSIETKQCFEIVTRNRIESEIDCLIYDQFILAKTDKYTSRAECSYNCHGNEKHSHNESCSMQINTTKMQVPVSKCLSSKRFHWLNSTIRNTLKKDICNCLTKANTCQFVFITKSASIQYIDNVERVITNTSQD